MLSPSAQPVTNSYRQQTSPNYQSAAQPQTTRIATGWRRVGYLVLAAITFGLSIVGIVLPGIPTTPFLLLTSYFLLRSSQRLHNRLLTSRMFGDLLNNWQQHRAIRRSTRTKAAMLTLTVVACSAWVGGFSGLLLLAMLGGAGVGVTVIFSLPVIES